MALQTALRSVSGYTGTLVYPVVDDGVVDAFDRIAVAGLYGGFETAPASLDAALENHLRSIAGYTGTLVYPVVIDGVISLANRKHCAGLYDGFAVAVGTIRINGHRRRSPKDLAKAALRGARYLGRVELDD